MVGGRSVGTGVACLVLALALAVVPATGETILPDNHRVVSTELWSLAGSPYVVSGTLTVDHGGES
jgi:hypothetical protein